MPPLPPAHLSAAPPTPLPAVKGALKATHIVVSVGPYSLIINRPGAQRSTNSAGQASPPTSKATDSKPAGDSIAAAEGVWLKTLTFSETSSA